MSINYELSLWREYPGITAIEEEKELIIAATGMDYAGRAQDIKLKREHSGKQTLTFEIPLKYFNISTGQDETNSLVEKIIDHSKLKLWRDEYWWNPFAKNKGLNEETGCTIFEGAWQQGRWYEFIVTERKQKRSKKKLMYSYTCDSLFMSELSRTGYELEFVTDTDIMSASGMGTAHELAKRIVDGTDWEYIKTEVFPDYKEEYNPITGETIKIPVSTDQIEFSKGLDRYVYCYEVDIDSSSTQLDIANEIETEGSKQGLNLVSGVDFYFDNKGIFNWRPAHNEPFKPYVYNYTKTTILTSYADKILCYTDGEMVKGNTTEKIEESTLLSSTNLWETFGNVTVDSILYQGSDGVNSYYLRLGNINGKSGEPLIYNSGYSDKPLDKGDNFVISMHCDNLSTGCVLYIYDGKPSEENQTPIQTVGFAAGDGSNCFDNSYIVTIKQRIKNPYFAFGYNENYTENGNVYDESMQTIDGLFMYKFVGATEKIDKAIKDWIAKQSGFCNKIENITDSYYGDATNVDLENNTCLINGQKSHFWLPPGTMAQNDFKNGTEVYCLEFNKNGEYIQIYPSFNMENLKKLSSFNTDKRRAISGSKSNRFSLLETISKTFYCFTRFLVEHDSKGYIVKNSNGKPKKYFTYVSELGRRNFNGFNYGLNLEDIERKIDSKELVTKVYVEPIDNQYNNSGMITIQNSDYNKMGERFFYNFSYFKRQGFFNASSFMEDYKDVYDYVSLRNAQAKAKNEEYIKLKTFKETTQTAYDTHMIQLSALKKEANEELAAIKWEYFWREYLGYGSIEESLTFPNIDFGGLVAIMKSNHVGATYLPDAIDTIARYMYDINVNGLPENNIKSSLSSISTFQTQWNNLDATTTKENDELTKKGGLNERVQALLDDYNALIEEKNKKLNWFEKKYRRFILEGTWSGNDYIEPDTYYLDATRAMATSCMPKVSYSVNVVDLTKICNPYDPSDTEWGKDFTYDVGDITYVRDEELFGNLEQKSMISSIDTYVDVNKPDDITLTNYETRFEELFQSIAAAVTTIQLNENIYGRAENFTPEGAIDVSILQKSFDTNKNLVISSANNLVTQDNKGITVSSDDNSGKILRAIAGGIFLSKDNGQTFTAGLTADGFNASLITAGQIDTSKIVIRSSDVPQYIMDDLGLTGYSSVLKDGVRDTSFVRFDQFGIYMTDNGRMFGRGWWDSTDARGEGVQTTYTKKYVTMGKVAIGQSNLMSSDFYIELPPEIYNDTIHFKIIENSSNKVIYDGNCISGTWSCSHTSNVVQGLERNDNILRFVYKPGLQDVGYYGELWDEAGTKYYFSEDWKKALENYKDSPDLEGWYEDCPVASFRIEYDVDGGTVYYGREGYIQRNSIFSLTRKGLVINSGKQSNETYGGSVQISTEVPQINIYSVGNTKDDLRVRIGYLTTDGEKKIHGIDIYDGAIAIYDRPQGVSGCKKILYTERQSDNTVLLKIEGKLEANLASIAGWSIGKTWTDGNGITQSNDVILVSGGTGLSATNTEGDPAFWAGFDTTKSYSGTPWGMKPGVGFWQDHTKFYVTKAGSMKATSGTLGGWTFTNDFFYKQSDSYAIGIAFGDIGGTGRCFGIGQFDPTANSWGSNLYFSVTGQGKLYAREADIEGVITATDGTFTGTINANEGSIGGLTIYNNSSTDKGLYTGGMGMNSNTGKYAFYAGETNNTHGTADTNAPFKVGHDGSLHCTQAIIKGTISAGSQFGSGAWKISGNWLYSKSTSNDSTTPSGARIVMGPGGVITYTSTGVVENTRTWSGILSSDRDLKDNIMEFSNEYEVFFDSLKPRSFNYNTLKHIGNPSLTHFGFVAQDVIESQNNANLSQLALIGNYSEEYYGLYYDEFIALNTWQIQKAKARISTLETEVAELKSQLQSLTKS